ncbi:MAG: hypothetical protein H7Y38_21040 [Armatimonadetes bacterium]|nr:hypothetical protein [Armatimonadota bacterium]
MRISLSLPALFLCIAAVSPAWAQLTVRSQGTFTDKTAAPHRWYVNGAHTMVWDDKPYVPVGGRFVAKSWSATATAADYDADVAALKSLQKSGVTDIYVQAAGNGLTTVKPANIQKLVDFLDENGFTYGVSINDGPREPLLGYVVRPGAHRQIVPSGGGELTFPVVNAASGLFFTVSSTGGELRDSGEATVNGDTLRVSVKDDISPLAVGSGTVPTVAILLPERIFTVSDGLQMRNLWDGFDPYRDALITLFAQVKFGKGFRFVCDPLPANLALTDAFGKVIPTSAAFRTEWAAYLGTKYRSLPNVIAAWGIQDPLVTSFDDVAKLLPLWYGGKGIAQFHDTQSKKTLRATWDRSAFWDDLAAFKRESVRGYMNDLAVTLKRTVADVPVVYRNGAGAGWNELFDDLPAAQGFDGFGIVATGRGSDAAARSGAYTFAQASACPKTIWLPVLSVGESVPAKPFADKTSLSGTFDWLRESGAKGFFVNLSPTAPEQNDWLKSYATVLDATGMRTRLESAGASQAPSAVFYPRRDQTDLVPTVLSTGGGWWLPTNRAGQVYDFGSAGRAYGIEEPNAGFVYYLWNPAGTRKITLTVPKTATDGKTANRVAWSANAKGELKKQTLTLTIGQEPVRLLNYPVIPVPQEAYPEARTETDAFAKAEKTAKSVDAGRYALNATQIYYKKDNPLPGVQEILALLARMRFEKRNYFWYDVEYAPAHSFDETSPLPGASGNRVLRVDERADNAPAVAQIKINFGEQALRDVWLSVSPNALISLRLDGRPLITTATIPTTAGGLYANGSLIWTRFGSATIPKGEHVLEIRADGAALVDALLLSRGPFDPNGANPPPVEP